KATTSAGVCGASGTARHWADADRLAHAFEGLATRSAEGQVAELTDRLPHAAGGEHLPALGGGGHPGRHVDVVTDQVVTGDGRLTPVDPGPQAQVTGRSLDQLEGAVERGLRGGEGEHEP